MLGFVLLWYFRVGLGFILGFSFIYDFGVGLFVLTYKDSNFI